MISTILQILVLTSNLGDSHPDRTTMRLAASWDRILTSSDVFFVGEVVDVSQVISSCMMTVRPVTPVLGSLPASPTVVVEVCGDGRDEAYKNGETDVFRHDVNGHYYGTAIYYRSYPSTTWETRFRHLKSLLGIYAPGLSIDQRSARLAQLLMERDVVLRGIAVAYAAAGNRLSFKSDFSANVLVSRLLEVVDSLDMREQGLAASILRRCVHEHCVNDGHTIEAMRQKSKEIQGRVVEDNRRRQPESGEE